MSYLTELLIVGLQFFSEILFFDNNCLHLKNNMGILRDKWQIKRFKSIFLTNLLLTSPLMLFNSQSFGHFWFNTWVFSNKLGKFEQSLIKFIFKLQKIERQY